MKLIIITIIKHHNSKHYIHSIFILTIIIRVCFKNTALKYPGCWPNIFDRSSLTTVYKWHTQNYLFLLYYHWTTRYNFVHLKVMHKISPLKELVGGDLPSSSSQRLIGRHPGYYKAVFLKKTQTIIVSFNKYTVYIMFWIMMLYDCYYY